MKLREQYLPYKAFTEVDNHTTNKSIGYSALIVIIVLFGILVLSDLPILFRHLRMMCQYLKQFAGGTKVRDAG